MRERLIQRLFSSPALIERASSTGAPQTPLQLSQISKFVHSYSTGFKEKYERLGVSSSTVDKPLWLPIDFFPPFLRLKKTTQAEIKAKIQRGNVVRVGPPLTLTEDTRNTSVMNTQERCGIAIPTT